MFSTRTDAIIVNLRIFFLCTDFSFPLLSVLYKEGNYKTMDFQNPLTPAAFVLYCIAQISQCALLENNGVEKGSSEVSGSMMQSCSCLGFSAHFLRINEVQYFEQVTRRGYFSQTLVFPVSKTIHTNWPRLERAFSKTHWLSLKLTVILWISVGAGNPSAARAGALTTNSSYGELFQAADGTLQGDGLETGRTAGILHISAAFLQDPNVPTSISQSSGKHQWLRISLLSLLADQLLNKVLIWSIGKNRSKSTKHLRIITIVTSRNTAIF